MNQAAKAAAAMFLYAALLVGGGVLAYALAPEGANARTALIVPTACAGAMVLSAILALQIHRVAALGRAGLFLGVALPLLFGSVIGFRAWKTGGAVAAYRAAETEFVAAADRGEVAPGVEARREFFAARSAPDHDKAYLRNTLWALTAVSIGSFLLIRAKRP